MVEITIEKINNHRKKLFELLAILKPYYENTKNLDNPKIKFIKVLKYINDGFSGPLIMESRLNLTLDSLMNSMNINSLNNGSYTSIPENELKLIKKILESLHNNFGDVIDYAYDRYFNDFSQIEKANNKVYNNLYDLLDIVMNKTEVLKSVYMTLNNSGSILLFENNNAKKNLNMDVINREYPNEGILNTNTIRNLSSFNKLNDLDTGMCMDPILFEETEITEDSTKLYILDNRNRITRIFCLDAETINMIFKDKSNVFYRCKDTVRNSALMIGWKDVINTPIRRIPLEYGIYVYDGQLNDLDFRKGRSYILQPTEEVVGRLASHSVVTGGRVVGALHCQPVSGTDYIYSVKEYEPLFGGVRSKRKTRRNKKYRTKKAKSMKMRR